MQFAPDVYTDEDKSVAATNAVAAPTPAAPLPPPDHRLELLPATCPNCGGPIRGKDVKWTGPQSADCPYCGAILHMQSGQAESRPD
jgi:predicted Zn-ribbon and HTH transcriptional regulator